MAVLLLLLFLVLPTIWQIEEAMAGKDGPAKACAILKLRERVRQVKNLYYYYYHHYHHKKP